MRRWRRHLWLRWKLKTSNTFFCKQCVGLSVKKKKKIRSQPKDATKQIIACRFLAIGFNSCFRVRWELVQSILTPLILVCFENTRSHCQQAQYLKVIKSWPNSRSAVGGYLYNHRSSLFHLGGLFSQQQCWPYTVFFMEGVYFKLGCMNELKSGQIQWKIVEYLTIKEKKNHASIWACVSSCRDLYTFLLFSQICDHTCVTWQHSVMFSLSWRKIFPSTPSPHSEQLEWLSLKL